ncbi:MAG TPA: hypothetical protein VGL59_03935 [Polyangia bacterium]
MFAVGCTSNPGSGADAGSAGAPGNRSGSGGSLNVPSGTGGASTGSGGSSSGNGGASGGGGTASGGFDGGLPDIPGDASAGVVGRRSAAGFFHPGIVVTQGGLNAVRNRLAMGDPDLKQALAALQQDLTDATLPACPSEDSAGRCFLPPVPAAPAGHVTVTCGSHSAAPAGDTSCDDEKANAMAAYSHALFWYLTQDESEAQKAIAFLDAWNNVTAHIGYMASDNSPLQTGWTGTLWARAAELIRYTYPQSQYAQGWPDGQAQAFGRMLTTAIRPYVNVDINTSPDVQNGNWEGSEADAFLQIAVYNDNMADYQLAIKNALSAIKYYIYLQADGATPTAGKDVITCTKNGKKTSGCGVDYWWGIAKASGLLNGTSQETCRDLEHVQYGLGAFTNAAETAAIQNIAGADLYGDTTVNYGQRLLAAFEFHADVLKGRSNFSGTGTTNPDLTLIPAPSLAYTCDGLNGFTMMATTSAVAQIAAVDFGATRRSSYPVQPMWEMGYNHFVNVENKPMPKTLALLVPAGAFKGNRPTLASHPLAWETLTKLGTAKIGFPE